MSRFPLRSILPIFLSTIACAQNSSGDWVYSVQRNGIRKLHLDSKAVLFGKETKVRLQFSCLPTKSGVIEVALVVGDYGKLTEFHFQEFDEWNKPTPNDIDMAITVRGVGFTETFHDCPAGWPGEALNGFHFPSTGSAFNRTSITRRVIDSLLRGASEIEILVSDKKHPTKAIKVRLPMASYEAYLRALTHGIG